MASVERISGDTLTPPLGNDVTLAVRVRDSRGRLLAREAVTFAVSSGGGSVFPARVETDERGEASAKWTLAPRLDSLQAVVATTENGTRAEFIGRAVPGLDLRWKLSSGAQQSATVGTELPDPLVMEVRLPDGRPVQGAIINWKVDPGNGTITPTTAVTDASGRAIARWVLPTRAGGYVAKATFDLLFAEFRVTATALAGPPTQADLVGGRGQVDTVGRKLPERLQVRLRDAYNNLASTESVRWTVESGGGVLSPPPPPFNSFGISTMEWTLGGTVGMQRVRAEAPSLGTFIIDAEAKIGPITRLVIDQRNLTVKQRTRFTLTASAYDVFNNRYADSALVSRVYWLTPDISVLRLLSNSEGTFDTPGIGRAAVWATAFRRGVADTVFVNVLQ